MNYQPDTDCKYSRRLIEKLSKLAKANSVTLDFIAIERAISFIKKYHDGQYRKRGEPFYTHPLQVAYLISDYLLRTNVIVTSILHDVVEDTEATIEMVHNEFGGRIAEMVEMLTRDRPDGTKLTVEQILTNAYEKNDQEVLLIKLIDRLHNMQTINAISREKLPHTNQETLKYFLVLVEELGLTNISNYLFRECTKINIQLNIVDSNILKNNTETFDTKPFLPFPTSQSVLHSNETPDQQESEQ